MSNIYAVYITRKSLLNIRYVSGNKSFCIGVFNKESDAIELIKKLKIVFPECKFYKLKLRCL